MKTKLSFGTVLAFFLIPFLTLQAQITINLDDIKYDIDGQYKMHSRDGSLWIVSQHTGKIGGPFTWDFTAGPTDSDYTFDYILPSSSPCESDFPLAAITEKKTGGGDPAFMFLDFQAGTGRINYGVCQPPTIDPSWIFTPPLTDFPSTITFMDNWTGNTTFATQMSGLDIDVLYDFNAFCNGYGDLILPDGLGNFPCLQVSYLEHYKFFWMGTLIQESYVQTFYWIIPDAGIAVIISSQDGTTPPGEDFTYSNIFSRMYESSKLNNEFLLNLTVFLEGAYDASSGTMNTSLNPENIPTAQPFNVSPWYYNGTEAADPIPSNDIVDWVLIELRDTTSASEAIPATIIAQQAAFVLNDGSVVGMDGTSQLIFDYPISNNLFAVVWHRNHLGVISATHLTGLGGNYAYNFSTAEGQALGGPDGHKSINPGVWGMIAGDANGNGEITGDDLLMWGNEAGQSDYKSSDFDMDSQVNNPDKNSYWSINSGSTCRVPE